MAQFARKVTNPYSVMVVIVKSAWVHRQCAGLSKEAFRVVSNSDAQFSCPCCVILQHAV